ncbi:hypothetical protein [Candidatus Enterovibrio escicola]|uniref:hypothetical protein n=1 Tax=Candidatus Enterovibrio escicola TaxID=1927127 RepID=UPI000BE2E338
MRGEQLTHGLVTFLDTKNNKNKPIPVGYKLNAQLKQKGSGHLFNSYYVDLYSIVKNLELNPTKG